MPGAIMQSCVVSVRKETTADPVSGIDRLSPRYAERSAFHGIEGAAPGRWMHHAEADEAIFIAVSMSPPLISSAMK